ncbi:MAG TPA: hypothetical protein VHD62_02600 [Opitutaceae bacterium]|nr:hypothetical protein [Opitutaceae bacterium]
MRPEHTASPLVRLAGSAALRALAIAFVVVCFALRWDGSTGFTSLMRFGEKNVERRLPALQTLPVANARAYGYDGQFYAQLAVEPHVTNPDLVRALDKPSYRARRILLPLVAHALGGGRPWLVLQVYALLNLAAWLWLAAVLWRLLPPGDWRANAAWLAILLGVGALDSVRLGLTDLPAALFLVLAVRAMELGRSARAALWSLGAGFTREVSLLGLAVLRRHEKRRTLALRLAVALPVLAWCAWLAWRLPGPLGNEGNIDFPAVAFARALARNFSLIASGTIDPQRVFGILGGLGLAAQTIFVAGRARAFAGDVWLRLALPFAALFWLIGADPWLDYRAVARDCLPLTIAFNVLWARRAGAHPLWLFANIAAVDGVMRFADL